MDYFVDLLFKSQQQIGWEMYWDWKDCILVIPNIVLLDT